MNKHYVRLAQLLLDGDEDEAVEFTEQLLKKFPRAYLYEDIITPAMYYIGELWEKNKITVADEHLATAICDFVLSKIGSENKGIPPQKQQKHKALLFGVEKEQHYIGMKMAAETFKDEGWRVRYLGPNLSMEHSLTQIEKFRPDVIGISAALSYRLPTIKSLLHRFEELEWKPFIMVGGRMARGFNLEEFETDRVLIVKGLDDLDRWFKEGRDEMIHETS